jgi:hypothetical protein
MAEDGLSSFLVVRKELPGMRTLLPDWRLRHVILSE